MTTKIGDTVVMHYCNRCEDVFEDEEEGRCPHCWETDDTRYAILKLEGFEDKEY